MSSIILFILTLISNNNVSSFTTTVPIFSRTIKRSSRINNNNNPIALFESKEDRKEDIEEESLSNETENDDEEINFPAWVKGLRQWPLYPTKTGETIDEEGKDTVPRSWATRVPLSSLINVETLLAATGGGENTILENNPVDLSLLKEKMDSLEEKMDSQTTFLNEVENNNTVSNNNSDISVEETPFTFFNKLKEAGAWDNVVMNLQQSISELANTTTTTEVSPSTTANVTKVSSTTAADLILNATKSTTNVSETVLNETYLSSTLSESTESILNEATKRLEYLVSEVSTAISLQTVQDMILQAGQYINSNATSSNDVVINSNTTSSNDAIIEEQTAAAATEKVVDQGGLDEEFQQEEVRTQRTTTINFIKIANALLVAGYAKEDTATTATTTRGITEKVEEEDAARGTLFEDFSSARLLGGSDLGFFAKRVADMGSLCGAIYYPDIVPECHKYGHSLVMNSTTENVAWMVTDGITKDRKFENGELIEKSKLVRVITLRGFDASDESVDREELLVNICTASQEAFEPGLLVHSGLLRIAKEILKDIIVFIDNTAPEHKIILNGHSVGGSLCSLLLLLLAKERGSDFVSEKITRVYTFGAPPVINIAVSDDQNSLSSDNVLSLEEDEQLISQLKSKSRLDTMYKCDVLSRFDLPASKIFAFVQPWDPIPRLFSSIDPLYPLLGDLGQDGKTLYASGPPRTLRPLTRAIIESWEGWPRFRNSFRATVSQNYSSIGIQHLLLPEPVRYLSDRLVAVNVQVPPLDSIVRISAEELLPALNSSFPLDVFGISYVPAAIRSFVHHFYPAYEFPILDYAKKKKEKIVSSVDIAKLEKDFEKTEELLQNNDEKSIGSQWLQFPPDW